MADKFKVGGRQSGLQAPGFASVMIAMLLAALLLSAGTLANSLFILHRHTIAGWVLMLFPIAIIVITIPVAAVFLSRQFSQQLDLAEDGVTSRTMGQTSSLRWNEAHLFARYGTFGAQKSGAALTYELSSAEEIVRWTWVRYKTYPVGLEPTIPPDEYNRQMEALLSLVAAKTGLALYDLIPTCIQWYQSHMSGFTPRQSFPL